jgi:hypothetical protein
MPITEADTFFLLRRHFTGFHFRRRHFSGLSSRRPLIFSDAMPAEAPDAADTPAAAAAVATPCHDYALTSALLSQTTTAISKDLSRHVSCFCWDDSLLSGGGSAAAWRTITIDARRQYRRACRAVMQAIYYYVCSAHAADRHPRYSQTSPAIQRRRSEAVSLMLYYFRRKCCAAKCAAEDIRRRSIRPRHIARRRAMPAPFRQSFFCLLRRRTNIRRRDAHADKEVLAATFQVLLDAQIIAPFSP